MALESCGILNLGWAQVREQAPAVSTSQKRTVRFILNTPVCLCLQLMDVRLRGVSEFRLGDVYEYPGASSVCCLGSVHHVITSQLPDYIDGQAFPRAFIDYSRNEKRSTIMGPGHAAIVTSRVVSCQRSKPDTPSAFQLQVPLRALPLGHLQSLSAPEDVLFACGSPSIPFAEASL